MDKPKTVNNYSPLWVTPELHVKIKERCMREGRSMRFIVEMLLIKWLQGKITIE